MANNKQIDEFKDGKKVMITKMEAASKMADDAADEFVGKIRALAKNLSEEELKEFLKSKDEMIEDEDKLALIAAFADEHNAGIIALGLIGPHLFS